jgi:outer membrane protein assembly factor BamB
MVKRMEIFGKNNSKLSTIAFVLMITLTVSFVALPTVIAHDPALEIPRYSYVSIQNSVLGVGQQLGIIFWSNAVPPTAQGAYGDRWIFYIDVTTPSGSTDTLGPFTSDPVGSGWAVYTPTSVGTYTIVSRLAQQTITGLPLKPDGTTYAPEAVGDVYLAATSNPVTLTVQQDAIAEWPEAPLPTEYWTRPINGLNRNWDVLAGNWLGSTWQNYGSTTRFGFGLGPESAHVMWATPMWAGGVMDARFGDTTYETGHYEGLGFQPPVILNGKIYYNIQSVPREGYNVLDLYTGEQLWFQNSTGAVTGTGGGFDATGYTPYGRLAFGQVYNYDSPNQHGGFPYIWSRVGTTLYMYDSETGNYICSIANVPSWFGGSYFAPKGAVYGKDGSLLTYNIAGTTDPTNPFAPATAPFYLQCWNTSQAIWYEDHWNSNEYWMWRPTLNVTFNGNNGYTLNVSIPTLPGGILAVREGEYVIGGTSGTNRVGMPSVPGNMWAISLKAGEEGTLLWSYTYTPPYSDVSAAIPSSMFGGGTMSGPEVIAEEGVFVFDQAISGERWGFDLATGAQLWGPTPAEPAWQYYGMYETYYMGKILSYGYSGSLICYDIKTGDVLWTYDATNVGYESPYGNYPMYAACVADGKIYMVSGEHSLTQPLWRGPNLRCIDVETGAEVWKIDFMAAGDGGAHLTAPTLVTADGYIVGLNYYDNRIYCLGKGPSATTVSGPATTIPLGEEVLITGTVTDVSPGTQQLEQASRFPNGVPAVSDASQEGWMEYVYMQQGCPGNAAGVEVVITTLDPNGNTYELGRTTTSLSGTFGCAVNPPVPGLYKIIVTFEGSNAYYGSHAETYINVGQ